MVEKYGTGFDSVRSKIGLPLISGNLELKTAGGDYAIFENAGHEVPGYNIKSVFWSESGPVLERNYFDGPQNQRLQIYYGYRKELDWKFIGFGYALERKGAVFELTSAQADSVLRAWGLKVD